MCGILALLFADTGEVRLYDEAHAENARGGGCCPGASETDLIRRLGARQAHRGPDAQAVQVGPRQMRERALSLRTQNTTVLFRIPAKT